MDRSSRYLIGIDLGTTNSVVAYIDTSEAASEASPGIQSSTLPRSLRLVRSAQCMRFLRSSLPDRKAKSSRVRSTCLGGPPVCDRGRGGS